MKIYARRNSKQRELADGNIDAETLPLDAINLRGEVVNLYHVNRNKNARKSDKWKMFVRKLKRNSDILFQRSVDN